MSSRGLKLVVSPELQQNPSLELNNGGSARCNPVLFLHLSSSAQMLQRYGAHHPSWNAAASLPSQSLYLLTCTPPLNHTFLIKYQTTTTKKIKNLHPCNYAV
ncbi:hypothetical protein GQ457_15G015980 [Hibiscus cannabinus]